jgi:geranylgeranyl pyrophosphate synthase
LITEATKHANEEQKELLKKYYGTGEIGADGLKAIREVFEQTGSLDYSKQIATDHIERAKKVIPEITDDPKYQQILEELADYLINRSK